MGEMWDHWAKRGIYRRIWGVDYLISSPNNSVIIHKRQNPLFVRIAMNAFVSDCFCSYLFFLNEYVFL